MYACVCESRNERLGDKSHLLNNEPSHTVNHEDKRHLFQLTSFFEAFSLPSTHFAYVQVFVFVVRSIFEIEEQIFREVQY